MVHCWISRHESEGFDSWPDWLVADEERCRVYAEHMYDDDGSLDPTGGHDVCLLEDGHEGPHEFTAPGDVLVTFAPSETT